jgi:hypothetical protein
MRILFTLIMLCLCALVYAQKAPIKFGDIPIEDLKMKFYPQDSSVAAMVLGDYGESKFQYREDKGFVLIFERIRRIKIFRKDGYEFADFVIPLYHTGSTTESLGTMKAVTYNLENGKEVETKMKDSNIFREKYDANINLVKITFPNVKEGSIVEVSYSVTSAFLFNLQDWEFQSSIPTRWSEYRTKIPEYFSYQRYMQGYVSLAINDESAGQDAITFTEFERTSGSLSARQNSSGSVSSQTVNYTTRAYRWVAKDVPAFREEPNMTNTKDYVSKINFELASTQMPGRAPKMYMNSWEDLNNEFVSNEKFGLAVKSAGFLNKIAEEQTVGITDPKEKIAKLYHFVKDNIEWDGTYRKYVDENLKKAFDDHKGSSAEVNLMLVSLLQKADFKANPVLISTRNHGFIRKQYPLSSQFNYVLCVVTLDGKALLLDATDRTLPMSILPERCLNGEGYMIADQGSGWINVIPNFKSRSVSNFALTIDDGGAMTGTLSISREGYEAQKMRKLYSSKGQESYVNELASSHQWELANSKFDNTTKLSEAVKESHDVKIAEHIQSAGDILYLNPMVSNKIAENPFKAETRVYPVDFGSPFEQMTMGKFVIPAGYEIAELPAPKMFLLPEGGGKYAYNMVKVGDAVQFSSQLVINKPLFAQTEYPTIREFYNQVVAKQAEQIVIKKK